MSSLSTAELILLLGLPAFWLIAFLIYWAYSALFGYARTPHVDKLAVGPWLPRVCIEFGYFMYRLPVRLCIALHITADTLTLSSLGFTLIAAWWLAQGAFALGGWTLLLAFTCDGMDGVVARATGTSSDRGEFLDAIVDHCCDLITYLGFAYYYLHDLSLALVLCTLIGSSMVSYTRAKGEALGVDAKVGYMRRFERAVWLGGGTVLAPVLAAFLEPGAAHPTFHLVVLVMGLLAVLTHVTAIWRIRYVMVRLRPVSDQASVRDGHAC